MKSTIIENKLAVTEEELRQVLSESAFAKVYNFKLRSIAVDECALTVPFQTALERPGGIIAGTIYMTVADVAMWLAIMTRLGKDASTVTSEMTTAFLNSARQEDVWCSAKVLKFGKTRIYGVAECRSNAGNLLTHHTVTYARLTASGA